MTVNSFTPVGVGNPFSFSAPSLQDIKGELPATSVSFHGPDKLSVMYSLWVHVNLRKHFLLPEHVMAILKTYSLIIHVKAEDSAANCKEAVAMEKVRQKLFVESRDICLVGLRIASFTFSLQRWGSCGRGGQVTDIHILQTFFELQIDTTPPSFLSVSLLTGSFLPLVHLFPLIPD